MSPLIVIPNAVPGGVPSTKTDVPVSGVLIGIFATCAIIHATTFRRNKAQGRLFVFSMMTFGFCMSRIVTFSLRIAWANHTTNKDLAIAAQIFLGAGVVLLYIVNLVLTQRIMGALHPVVGRSSPVRLAFKVYYGSIVAVLIMVITTTVQSLKTTDPEILRIDLDIRKFGGIWNTIFAFIPIPITLISVLTPSSVPPTKLGSGSMSTKVIMVNVIAVLLVLGSAFRASLGFLPTRPMTNPAWYHERPAFYTFTPMLEILVVIFLAAMRFDKRFYLDGKAEAKRAQEQGLDIAVTDKNQSQSF